MFVLLLQINERKRRKCHKKQNKLKEVETNTGGRKTGSVPTQPAAKSSGKTRGITEIQIQPAAEIQCKNIFKNKKNWREDKRKREVTYQTWRQKCSHRREERSKQAAWLGVRSVTGLKLRLRAGRWGGDEQQRSADWNEPLSAGRQGGGRGERCA